MSHHDFQVSIAMEWITGKDKKTVVFELNSSSTLASYMSSVTLDSSLSYRQIRMSAYSLGPHGTHKMRLDTTIPHFPEKSKDGSYC